MKVGFLMGRKVGMIRIFKEAGESIAVTVIDVSGNRIVSVKNSALSGYSAVQVCFGNARSDRLNRSVRGFYAKVGIEPGIKLKEFRIPEGQEGCYNSGDTLGVGVFSVGSRLSVSGVTRGHGFAGAIKRHNFSSGDKSHGNSLSHNKPGSTGMCQDPGRVFPGKKMPGHMGCARRTVKNLLLFDIDESRNLLFVKGAVPGPKGGLVCVKSIL
ncbi:MULTISPECIES: 50S ribosomal protein L3 [Candidatus Ichthyocystis]|uniref:Large ribosomal subunit protein uL3 n=1 Tax=Candidatus Ichthyocystis hellenicum TaxID=1561003 RepID=A0A0S4M524_9BURK|nr:MULTISPECIES: 50S ribosomal protein L3 [Ichthyocystis]CUT17350.1 50S ribosomal protein L3 [Candidatus Ichthyocystis hellenicum]